MSTPTALKKPAMGTSNRSCVASARPKATAGVTASGTKNLESTVVVSDTGIDFQKRMLRSRRSPFSASRQ